MSVPKVAVIWERLGEYHHARLERAAYGMPLAAIEVAANDTTYAWGQASARAGYTVNTLSDDTTTRGRELRARMVTALDTVDPTVVAVPGWSAGYALFALDWARARGRGVVMMSDSNAFDAPRQMLAERIKRAVVAHADAGFAAGSNARAYLAALGLDATQVSLGYDVVDNAHFARPKETKPRERAAFLAVARFVARKNLSTLLDAYALYRETLPAGATGWPLVLVGDGPNRAALEAQSVMLGLSPYVTFAGFRDYTELPTFYHHAGAFILPSLVEQWGLVVNEAMAASLPVIVSETAGCAIDLVRPSETGLVFSPTDATTLAGHMAQIAAAPDRAAQMGAAASAHIATWGLDRFAAGLTEAAKLAAHGPRTRPGFTDVAILAGLVTRAAR